MAIEVNSTSVVCSRCGKAYGKRRGNFPVNYGHLYKGVGYVTVCRECIETLYNGYLSNCNNVRTAVRQVCRKLDLYWNDKAFTAVDLKSGERSVMMNYISRINTNTYLGKSYDDTLSEEGTLWDIEKKQTKDELDGDSCEDFEIEEDVIEFWGTGYTPDMYIALEQRRRYWMSKFPEGADLDIGTEAIIRQICSLELDINRDRAAGKPIDKSVNALNSLLGSASLKPAQRKDDADAAIDNTPFGVWIRRWENQRPIPEPDPELKDVDGIVRYIEVWFKGHLAKMLGKKNAYSKMYEDEIAKIRVERPEFDDEDDETLFNDVFDAGDDT